MSDYISLILAGLVSIFLVLYVIKVRRLEKENIRIQENINQTQLYFDEVMGHSDSIRRYRHDLRKHIRIVEEFLREGESYKDFEEYRELENYMSAMQNDVESTRKNRFCGHALLNAICEIKMRECEEADVSFETDISYSDLSFLDSFHLTGILMNLLDNALEAQQVIGVGEPRRITLKLEQDQPADDPAYDSADHPADDPAGRSRLRISVGNTVAAGKKPDFQSRKADRMNHGFGLGIAKEYSAVYGGQLSFHLDEVKHFLMISTDLYG